MENCRNTLRDNPSTTWVETPSVMLENGMYESTRLEMGNQQPSTFEEKLYVLAKNARFGDGHLWKHPAGVSYKVVYTSTTPELLEVKRSIAPEIFGTGVVPVSLSSAKGRYANAKPLYTLASLTHPVFTEVAGVPKESLFEELTLADFGLWYLDDGCMIRRSDSNSYRFSLSVGNCCEDAAKTEKFIAQLTKLFGSEFGRIVLNNSRASERNKSWIMTKKAAAKVLEEARKYGVLAYKFPRGEGSTTIQ